MIRQHGRFLVGKMSISKVPDILLNMIITRVENGLQIVESRRHNIVYAILSFGCGGLAAILGILTSQILNLSLVGVLFMVGGAFMAWSAETLITLLHLDGTMTIEYRRILGHKLWVRTLNRSNIVKLDYVKSFGETSTFFDGYPRISSIYFVVNFAEQIEIGSRVGGGWIFKNSVPLDAEAHEIANFLRVPLNTIMTVSLSDSIKNVYNPHDKMRPLFQRPTQEELDRERNAPAA